MYPWLYPLFEWGILLLLFPAEVIDPPPPPLTPFIVWLLTMSGPPVPEFVRRWVARERPPTLGPLFRAYVALICWARLTFCWWLRLKKLPLPPPPLLEFDEPCELVIPPVSACWTLAELIRWLLCVRFLSIDECEAPFWGTEEVDEEIIGGLYGSRLTIIILPWPLADELCDEWRI